MTPATPESAAIELVDRARLGDQNATAMLVRVRQNAAKGVEKARRAFQAAISYAKSGKKTPAKQTGPNVGAEPALRKMKHAAPRVNSPVEYMTFVLASPFAPSAPAAEILSRGPAIGNDILSLIGATFGSEPEKKAYEYGVMGPPQGVQKALTHAKPAFHRALRTGHVVGLAKRIQAARDGNIAAISKKAAWELS